MLSFELVCFLNLHIRSMVVVRCESTQGDNWFKVAYEDTSRKNKMKAKQGKMCASYEEKSLQVR